MTFTKGQQLAYDAMMSGENVFLTGEAGTGKSYVIRKFVEKKGRDVLVCAPTGVAAINVGGATLHKAFHLPPGIIHPKTLIKPGSVVIAAKTIIIDEISMCRFDIFSEIARILRKTRTHKQLIVVGDFYQLPPVLKDKERDYLCNLWAGYVSEEFETDDLSEPYAFLSKYWEKFHFRSICLTEQMRQHDDLDFLENLNLIRVGNESAIHWIMKNAALNPKQGAIYLSGRNDDVALKNKRGLDQINAVPQQYRAEIKGKFDKNDTLAEEILTLKTGCRVMALVNDTTDKKYVNGSLGTVKSTGNDYVIVDFENGNKNVVVRNFTWLAYDYISEEKEYKEYRLIIGRDDNTGKIKLSPWKVVADGEAIPTETVTEDGRALIRTVTKKSIIKIQSGSMTQIPLKLAYAVTIHKSQGQTYDAVVLNPYCFDSGMLYVALSRVRRITDLYLERPIEYTDLQTSYAVKDFYSRIQAEGNRNLLLPSYPVTYEEMKKFKTWWTRILKQRRLTGRSKQGEGLEINNGNEINNPEKLYEMGKSYLAKRYLDEALKCFIKAAEQGYVVAQYELGSRYRFGEGVPQDYSKAIKWLRKAAEQGNDFAQAELGSIYLNGEGTTQDYDEAKKWLQKAAEQGNRNALTNIGNMYKLGKGVEKNIDISKQYIEKATMNTPKMLNKKGDKYYINKAYEKAFECYKKAAEQGDASAQNKLGYMYENGRGVPENYDEAMKWYQKAEEQGHADVYVDIGHLRS